MGRLTHVLLIVLVSIQGALASDPPEFSGVNLVTGEAMRWRPGSAPSVVVFLSADCPCSKAYETWLKQAAAQYPTIQFLGVASNVRGKASGKAEAHFRQAMFPFTVAREPATRFADALGALNTPHAFVFDASGQVVYQGGIGNSRRPESAGEFPLAEALKAVSMGELPRVAKARALGCAIRR